MKEDKETLQKRLFIAIDIPEKVKSRIYDFTSGLFVGDRGIRVVQVPNIHVTLRFLGNTDINKIRKIEDAVKMTADSLNKFRYKMTGRINAFPSLTRARVVFMEIGEGDTRISELYNILDNNLSKIKIRKESRKFIPHITIARIRDKRNIEEFVVSDTGGPDGWMDCSDITLFESKLRPQGAEYYTVGRFGLK
jgi:2'-5' RNA ligase